MHSTTRPPRHVRKINFGHIFDGLPFSSEQHHHQQLKLNGESAKNIMTTFAFPYVSYLLYEQLYIYRVGVGGWEGGGVEYTVNRTRQQWSSYSTL